MELVMHFYNELSEPLRPLIRHLWHIENPRPIAIEKLLLPMDHVDLLLCDEGQFFYQVGETVQKFQGSHFHGLRRRAVGLQRIPEGVTIGITFTPWGFQHFAGGKMSRFRHQITSLAEISAAWVGLAEQVVKNTCPTLVKLTELRDILTAAAGLSIEEKQALGDIAVFLERYQENNLAYTRDAPAQVKYYQRLFNHYIGIPPKEFCQLTRFQDASRAMLRSEGPSLDMEFADTFYDQSHLIREFKKYTGISPGKFHEERPALKSHLDFE